ncbi:conserved virulence factor C family protein [Ornithinibacillus halophilus]|uniref:HEAT repeat-containing protein n=1 Tax=Ornithinibacillus halophilus TaxID=930117 RepID=A0A1M5DV18_9BACI|nr:conserved virulence factor C family protein [Ornithinibacillus halophilus]SHF70766.1 HEAT repeat-containing protein [Ornithinibacillus halophilus]
MKIVSIEPTPSPYSMKINVDERLPDGKTENYKLDDDLSEAPKYIKTLFSIDGVKGLYRVIDFIALERNPRTSWEEILPKVRKALGSNEEEDLLPNNSKEEGQYGEIKVFMQTFRTIPMQVKLEEGDKEHRFGLPDRFMNAVMEASIASDNMLGERKWIEQSPRYGNTEEIGKEVVEEISASYDSERLENLVKLASNSKNFEEARPWKKVTLDMLDNPDWKERYAALDRMDPTLEDLAVLDKALDDKKASIRRLATAYLGMIENKAVLPYLYKALKDRAVNVRRTAGDCLSDLGFTEAIPEMIQSLSDSSRLVRWRGAMFLYEIGDKTAIPALEETLHDPEFEVRMQAKMALARIQGGEEAKGSIWHQMTQATKQKDS